jgi:hypothetical protein
LTAFKTIPWKEVLVAAPSVVQGARKLWSSVKGKEEALATAGTQAEPSPHSHAEALAALDARLVVLESRLKVVSDEAAASSELIKSLAEQNSRLVQAVEILRIRTRALLWLSSVLALAILALFLWPPLR